MEWLIKAFEGLFAEVVQLISGMKLVRFLTPDMASKTMPDMALGYPITLNNRCLVWHRYLTPLLLSKS